MRKAQEHQKIDHRRQALAFEKAGLEWLAAAMPLGGAPVVKVFDFDPGDSMRPAILVEEKLSDSSPKPSAARSFGAALARTHLAGAGFFGAGPVGAVPASKVRGEQESEEAVEKQEPGEPVGAQWLGHGFMGSAVLPLREVAPASWEDFYAEDRLLPYIPAARDNGALGPNEVRTLERLCERLVDQKVSSPMPARFGDEGVAAARLHGDLWSGNVMWAPAGTLIDPAAHGGHPESDLAQLTVFGQSLMEEIYTGYQSVTPLVAGWEGRIALHQLHMLIVHAALFGGSYGGQTAYLAKQYC